MLRMMTSWRWSCYDEEEDVIVQVMMSWSGDVMVRVRVSWWGEVMVRMMTSCS